MRNGYTLLPVSGPPPKGKDSDYDEPHSLHFVSTQRLNNRKSLSAIISVITAITVLLCLHTPELPESLESYQTFTALWKDGQFGVTAQNGRSDNPGEGVSTINVDASGWQVFKPSAQSYLPTPNRLQPTKAQVVLSPACIDLWISQTELCNEVRQSKLTENTIDVAWTWVNASDAVWSLSRHIYSHNDSNINVGKLISGLGANRQRNLNQLLYSFRSIVKSLGVEHIGKFFLITADFPIVSTSDTPSTPSGVISAMWSKVHPKQSPSLRVKQIPTWLKPDEQSKVEVVAPSELFKAPNLGIDQQAEWKEKMLPMYNSLSVESQLGNLNATSDTIFYMNDDMYTRNQFSTSDFSTTIFGPVFRINRGLYVKSKQTGFKASDKEGEWPGLEFSNWLLDQRFGHRERSYLTHVAKSLSVPLLREVQNVFPEDYQNTAESRFRGQNDELQSCFMAVNYIAEKRREALLWSLIVGTTLDRNGDGELDQAEKQQILQTLFIASNISTSIAPASFPIRLPQRAYMNHHNILSQAGLPNPLRTNYYQAPMDGFVFGRTTIDYNWWTAYKPAKIACQVEVNKCFGPDFFDSSSSNADTNDLFKKLAFQNPECGDCFLTAFMWNTRSSKGVEAFLPPSTQPLSEVASPNGVPSLGLEGSRWQDLDFSLKTVQKTWSRDGFVDARHFATTLLMRYSHVYGTSSIAFAQMFTPESTEMDVNNRLTNTTNTALIAINDDISNKNLVEATDKVLQKWHQSMWSEKTPFEI